MRPDYNVLTLVFDGAALESRYRRAMHRHTLQVGRFGILLAIALFAIYGVLDWWLAREQTFTLWVVRAGILSASSALFAWSFHSSFERWQETTMACFALLLTGGLIVICIVTPDEVADQYYVGHLLIIVATYTLFGVRFPQATLVSLAIFGAYVAYEHLYGQFASPVGLTRATFVLSAVIVAGVGGYVAELQRRLAYYRSCVIEYDRARSAHSALHDPLTGLPNRRLFLEKLAHAVARDRRFNSRCAVLFTDIDGFKAVNDEHGHVFGDSLLKAVALRLQDCVRATDTVARFGGDEFVVLLEDVASAESVDMLIERVIEAFAAPCEMDDVQVPVVLSIGQAMHPADADSPEELLHVADQAMYRMKLRHR